MKKEKPVEPNYELFKELKANIDVCVDKMHGVQCTISKISRVQSILYYASIICTLLIVGIPQLYIVSMRVLVALLYMGYFSCLLAFCMAKIKLDSLVLEQSNITMTKLKMEQMPEFIHWLLGQNGNQ